MGWVMRFWWAVAVVLAACASVPSKPTRTCDGGGEEIYSVSKIRHASPLYAERFVARAIQPRVLVGAKLFLDAEPGLTQPYLERVLSCRARAEDPLDPLRVQNADEVSVGVQGPYFVIYARGADRASAREIWRRAQALISQD